MRLLFLVLRDGCGAGECVFLDYPLAQRQRSSRSVRLNRGVSLRRPLKEFPVLGVHALCASKFCALFLYDLVSGSPVLRIWEMHVEHGTLDSSGDDFVRRCNIWIDSGYGVCDSTWLSDEFHTISTSTWTRILKRSFSIRFEWRIVLSRCFSSQLGTLETLFMASSWLICVG